MWKEMPAKGLRHVALEWPSGIHIIKKGLVGAARKICQDGAWSFLWPEIALFARWS